MATVHTFLHIVPNLSFPHVHMCVHVCGVCVRIFLFAETQTKAHQTWDCPVLSGRGTGARAWLPWLISALRSSRTGSGRGSCRGHGAAAGTCVPPPPSTRQAALRCGARPPEGSSGVKVTAGDTGLAAKLLGQKNVHPVWDNPRIRHVSPLRGGF